MKVHTSRLQSVYTCNMRKFKEKLKTLLPYIPTVMLGIMVLWNFEAFAGYDRYGIPLFGISCIVIVMMALMEKLPQEYRGKNAVSVFLFLLSALLIEIAVEILNGNMLWDIDIFGNVVMNYLLVLIIQLIIWAITGSMKVSMRSSAILLEIFGTVNFYVKKFKGSPLLPWDITSVKTAAAVAGSYTYDIGVEIIFSLVCVLLVWKCAGFVINNPKTKKYRYARSITAACLAGLTGLYYGTDILSRTFGATPDFFNQTRGYESKGALAEFLVNTKYMSLSEPDGYDASNVEEDILKYTSSSSPSILESVSGEDTVSVENPNIIVIMNESYSDLSVIGDFDTNEDYMPYVNSLTDCENVIEGNLYVSTIGTGTSNTEYEFLTNNTMAFLPYGSNAYQRYVDHDTYSLVSTLKSQGYSADVMHPYYKDDWNRPAVYEYFGFDSFTAYEDKPYWDKLRRYVSDECDFETIIEMYEERDPDTPFFLFNITMQNHSSYDQEDPDFIQEISLENMDGEYPLTEQYLSLIKVTDDAFRDLIGYFENVNEPTVILMFGDHQPFIEDEFYEEVMGSSLSELSDEENQKRYITRFVLWANYDIPEGRCDAISANYLSILLSQCTNTEMTPYMEFLNTLYEDVPVITALGCKDSKGTYFKADEENPYEDILSVYRNADFNLIREDENRADDLYVIDP